MSPIPVMLLTGFLGSGKTTLLSQVLRDPRFHDAAVVINEFGEVGLDHELVEHSAEQFVEVSTGCLCCNVRGDILRTLLDLRQRRDSGAVPAFRRLIVETTGLADPAPVLYSLTSDRDLRRWFSFGGIVATVDAVNADRTLGLHPECFKQIAVADRLVVTKADLCHDPASLRDLARIMGILRRLNPGAPILDRSAPDFDPARLFDASFHDLTAKPQNVTGWLNVDAYSSGRAEADDARPAATGARQGDRQAVNRHGADIRAFNLILDEPISSHAFATALELLVGFQGADLLRVKSIVCLREYPECPIIVHGVQHVFHDPVWLDRWPSADRRTRLVFITRNIRKDTVEAFFAAWRDADADPQTARPARRQGDGSRRSDPTARSMGG